MFWVMFAEVTAPRSSMTTSIAPENVRSTRDASLGMVRTVTGGDYFMSSAEKTRWLLATVCLGWLSARGRSTIGRELGLLRFALAAPRASGSRRRASSDPMSAA